jgi:membrane-bound ClpP family serine protease
MVAVTVFCVWLGFSVNALIGCLSLLLLLLLLDTDLIEPPGTDVVVGAIFMIIIFPVYILKQFILGFPDRHSIFLSPPAGAPSEQSVQDISEFNSAIGSVTATLKPAGKIQINGVEYPATSADGKFVDIGCEVQVCGRRDTLLLVSRADTTRKESAQQIAQRKQPSGAESEIDSR